MKKFLRPLLLLVFLHTACIILNPTEAKAASQSDLSFIHESTGYFVRYCKKSASGALTIPATYNGEPVTGIVDGAFSYCEKLTSITIPDSVTSIDSDASITNPRAYIYNVGDAEVADIYDETALQKIATPTQVWGIGSILKKQLTPGTYVIHLHYNVDGGAKSTVALQITI